MSHGEAEPRNQLASQQFELKQQLAELQAALGMKTDGVVVCCDWLAGMFRRLKERRQLRKDFLAVSQFTRVEWSASCRRRFSEKHNSGCLRHSITSLGGLEQWNPWRLHKGVMEQQLFLTAPASRCPPRLTSRCAVRTPCVPAIDLILNHPFFV